jgi:hypothetical protein
MQEMFGYENHASFITSKEIYTTNGAFVSDLPSPTASVDRGREICFMVVGMLALFRQMSCDHIFLLDFFISCDIKFI